MQMKCVIAYLLAASLCWEAEAIAGTVAEQIVEAGVTLNALGLFAATAGNLSARIDEEQIAITVSGKHKGEMTAEDIILVNKSGVSLDPSKKPSAETALHLLIYRLYPSAGAVIHTHSPDGTVLSRCLNNHDAFVTEGYEIHKAFTGISSHESRLELPIFENSQDYDTLCRKIEITFQDNPQQYGFFLRGHGLYTWGKDVNEAKIRTEAFEFLFQCELKMHLLQGR